MRKRTLPLMLRPRVLCLCVLCALCLATSRPAHRPWVIIDKSVASDFRLLIEETWDQFMLVFAARAACFGAVRIKADHDMTDRAMYDPRTATITVRVPERGSILKGALVHEWAHHVEFQCDAQSEMRAAFIAAQGLPANTPWRLEDGTTNIRSSDWANIPSEQYAEAAIVLVLGKRTVWSRAPITVEGVEVIRMWVQKNGENADSRGQKVDPD